VRKLLRSDDGARKPVLAEDHILNLGEWDKVSELNLEDGVELTEPEDLIPTAVAAEVGRRYAIQFLGLSSESAAALDADVIKAALTKSKGNLWDALRSAFEGAFQGGHIEKVGFAKELAQYVEASAKANPRPPGFPALEGNFAVLVADLARRLRHAQSLEQDRRTRNRTRQIIDGFLGDRPAGSSRDAAAELIHEIESALEDTYGDEEVRRRLHLVVHDFELNVDPQAPVDRYEDFADRLRGLDAVRRDAYRNRSPIVIP
jgi:hypothetical protein